MMKKILLVLSVFCITTTCSEIVEVEDISNETVVLLAPTNSAVLNTTNLTFTWQDVEQAETYHIQIATPTFAEALQIVEDSTLTTTNFTTTLQTNTYQWRVRAENFGFNTTYTTQDFTIEE